MKAWTADARVYDYSEDIMEALYINHKISDYLEIGHHEKKFYLVGPKGSGKTLFMQIKSGLYRNSDKIKGYRFYPEKELCESISISKQSTLSQEELFKFQELDIWENIWQFTLATIACRINGLFNSEDAQDKAFLEMIDHAESASSILAVILYDRSKLQKFIDKLYFLSRKLAKINNGVAIFIDEVDYAFKQFLTSYPQKGRGTNITPPVKLWINTHLGLIGAILNINMANSHVKVFTTIRSEAFKAIKSDLRLNYHSYTTVLQYSKEEIRTIFEKNIAVMDNKMYINPDSSDSLLKFLGFNLMPHPFAVDTEGKKREENAFDFFYRHTFGRPREMMVLGDLLVSKLIQTKEYRELPIEEKIEKVRWEVNEISHELFLQYQKEIIPGFDNEEFMDFLKKIHYNVFLPNASLVDPKLTKYYYCLGIIGITTKTGFDKNSYLKQIFLPVADYTYDYQYTEIPNTEYLVTHPATDNTFKMVSGTKFYNKKNIIGSGYKFEPIMGEFFHYDVAFSFAGEDRDFVIEVVNELGRKNVRVFYDDKERAEMWGTNLIHYLSDVYSKKAQFCVVFVSKHYREKYWTKLEFDNVLDRMLTDSKGYILPVKCDETELPGLLNAIAFERKSNHSPKSLAKLIIRKL